MDCANKSISQQQIIGFVYNSKPAIYSELMESSSELYLGIFFLVLSAIFVTTGKMATLKGGRGVITKKDRPREFWIRIGLTVASGILWIVLGVIHK